MLSFLKIVSIENKPRHFLMYRAPGKSMHFLLSRTQAGQGRTVKQEQEEMSRNHVQTFIYLSVVCTHRGYRTTHADFADFFLTY